MEKSRLKSNEFSSDEKENSSIHSNGSEINFNKDCHSKLAPQPSTFKEPFKADKEPQNKQRFVNSRPIYEFEMQAVKKLMRDDAGQQIDYYFDN